MPLISAPLKLGMIPAYVNEKKAGDARHAYGFGRCIMQAAHVGQMPEVKLVLMAVAGIPLRLHMMTLSIDRLSWPFSHQQQGALV